MNEPLRKDAGSVVRAPGRRIRGRRAFVAAFCTAGAIALWHWALPRWLDTQVRQALQPAQPWVRLAYAGLSLRPWGALLIEQPTLGASPWYGAWLGLPFGYGLQARELRIDQLRFDSQLQLRAMRVRISELSVPDPGWAVQVDGPLQPLLASVTLGDAGHAALSGDITLQISWAPDLRTAEAALHWQSDGQGRLDGRCRLDAPQAAVRADPRNLLMRGCELDYADAGLARGWWQALERQWPAKAALARRLESGLAAQRGLDVASRRALLDFLRAEDRSGQGSPGVHVSLKPARPAPLLMRPYNGWLAGLRPSLRLSETGTRAL